MEIETYDGDTWVAYVDIAGFKDMMKDEQAALDALSEFYEAGYDILRRREERTGYPATNGIFFSDCGTMFCRFNDAHRLDRFRHLSSLLEKVKELHRRMIQKNIMLKTSIAYGKFRYERRLQLAEIRKDMVYGSAFVNAYFDNEKAEPRLRSGLCRITMDGRDGFFAPLGIEDATTINPLLRHHGHLYFYWMVENDQDLARFQKEFAGIGERDWDEMRKVIRKYALPRERRQHRGVEAENGRDLQTNEG